MLFNSVEFAIFLPLVFVLYWFVFNKNTKLQNCFVVFASYLFYSWWDYRFLLLIIISSALDFFIGLRLSKVKEKRKRKLLLIVSIVTNLGILAFFKYYNFFIESFSNTFTFFGKAIDAYRLDIVLPIGISFYTLQTLSYTIDVYRKKVEPTKDVTSFFAFVAFFPQLVAGPIERAKNLLPQFEKTRTFSYEAALNGLSQMVWGLFKKMVVADNCAVIVNQIFFNYNDYSGSTLLLGLFLFSIQIYGDFSGYSDIAIGTAKLFGLQLKQNFAYPYFSKSISEFWRKWHISLMTWFKEYLYIPLGGNKGGFLKWSKNIMVVFVVSGFWHGASLTFIVWGFYNALILLLTRSLTITTMLPKLKQQSKMIIDFFKMVLTFTLILFGWVFFRSDSLSSSIEYLSIIFSKTIIKQPYVFGIGKEEFLITIFMIFIQFSIEWYGQSRKVPIYFKKIKKWVQWLILLIFSLFIFLFSEKQNEFIYFQF